MNMTALMWLSAWVCISTGTASILRPVRTLLIDNYDSYTYNVYHLLSRVNQMEPFIVYNDAYTDYASLIEHIGDFDNIVISPGPGSPDNKADFGICSELILEAKVPILGICLGHQGICSTFGGEVTRAKEPMHGRLSRISHSSGGIFASIPQNFEVVRYHSLIAESVHLPMCLRSTAWTHDGTIMGLEHNTKPIYGVQFHPESISSEYGDTILENFKQITLSNANKSGKRSNRYSLMPKESKVIIPKAGKSTDSVVYITSTLIPDSISTLDLFKHMYGKESTSFWLDSASKVQYSADVNKKQLSFMGAMDSTSHVIEYLGNNELLLRHANGSTIAYDSNIFKYLHDNINLAVPPRVVVDECIPIQGRHLPFSILEAWFGYIGYEGRFDAEAIFASASSGDVCAYDYSSPADVGSVERLASLTQPVALLLHPAVYLVFDHDDSRLYTVSRASDDETARVQAEEVMRKVRELVEGTSIEEHNLSELLSDPSPSSMLTASRSESDYRADIARCLEEIRQGETYEVCLTVQFRGRSPPSRDPLDVYEVLRARNPAPYASFIRYNPQLLVGDPSLRWYSNGGLAIMSSSPERYLKSNLAGDVESKPIKGTARRDLADIKRDEAIAAQLQSDEKSRAENLMIVDLVRNDLGRVCQVGSVRVPNIMEVETYASVHQLVSTITGRLRPSCNVIDAIVATFPGGSMTGAPKKRTMGIIDSIEGRPRGIYSGAIGYIGSNNVMDLSIVIRTAVMTGDNITVSAGGAIVAMSDPEAEVEEVLLKATAVASAINCTISFKP